MDEQNKPEIIAKPKKRRWPYILLAILIAITLLLGGTALAIYLSIGDMSPEQAPTIDAEPAEPERESEILDSYTVRRNGKLYRYNDQVVTLLLLGVDQKEPDIDEGSTDSGICADVILLAAIDKKNNRVTFYTVSRDSMCDFTITDPESGGTLNVNGQLALTYTYGDGGKTSCEMTRAAVSQLLFDLPIYSCSALYIDGLGKINDAVGGVTVTILEDIRYGYSAMRIGEEVTLTGDMAMRYIRTREHTEVGNLKRMERQKQYFKALLQKALSIVREDYMSVLDIYDAAKSEVITDLSVGDILYLASRAAGMEISGDVISVPGEVQLSEDNYVEYIIDRDALTDIIMSIYYEEVTQ